MFPIFMIFLSLLGRMQCLVASSDVISRTSGCCGRIRTLRLFVLRVVALDRKGYNFNFGIDDRILRGRSAVAFLASLSNLSQCFDVQICEQARREFQTLTETGYRRLVG